MVTINADLFRIAHICASTEETRYYLQGVFVTPARAGGAHLVATDGHSMLVVYDAYATDIPERGVILKADKKALTQMKRGKRMHKRTLTAELAEGEFLATLTDWTEGAESKPSTVAGVMLTNVEGAFPDWGRVLPIPGDAGPIPPQFNAAVLSKLLDAATELGKLYQKRDVLVRVSAANPGDPAAVSFGIDMPAFAVAMPFRGSGPVTRPAWL